MRSQLETQARELRLRRHSLLNAAQEHGVTEIRIFGSFACDEAETGSDIDLLVDLKPGRTLLDLVAFQRKAREILDMPVDVATADILKERIRDEVLAEALPI